MSNDEASLIQKEKTEPVPRLPLMRPELLQAAVEGNENDLIRLLGLQGDGHEVQVHFLEGAPNEVGITEENVRGLHCATHTSNTVLHMLAINGQSELISMCHQRNPSLLRYRNNKLETPLHRAAEAGEKGVTSKLIELARTEGGIKYKEFLRGRNYNEETALHVAARHGHENVVSVLMLEDPELAGELNKDKVSPLYIATNRGSIDVVKTMIKALSDRVVTPEFYAGPHGQTALHAAVFQDAVPEKKPPVAVEYFFKKTFGYSEFLQGLVTRITKVIEARYNKEHQLLFTTEILQLKSVRPLAKAADVSGNTPLHFAASSGCSHLVELLLKTEPSLGYCPNSVGLFPVHYAARMGNVKAIQVFLERCLDTPELLDLQGKNFLHIAAEENKPAVFYKLLGNHQTRSAYYGALSKTIAIDARLMELWKRSRNKLQTVCKERMFARIINARDYEGNTPLHLAVEKGHSAVVRVLSEATSIDLHLLNDKGLTPIDISFIKDYKKIQYAEEHNSLIEDYVRTTGTHFNPRWLENNNKDPSSTGKPKEYYKSSVDLKDQMQILGLGSVLIATVTFAAAFTLPGGYNPDTGSPVLARRYLFKSFILADVLAFSLSFICTMILIYCSTSNLHRSLMKILVQIAVRFFNAAAKCVAVAMASGLYLVLAPVTKGIGIVVMVALSLLLLMDRFIFYILEKTGFIPQTTVLLRHVECDPNKHLFLNYWFRKLGEINAEMNSVFLEVTFSLMAVFLLALLDSEHRRASSS